MNENKIVAAILTIATNARESRDSSAEVGKETGVKPLKTTNRFLPSSTVIQSRRQVEALGCAGFFQVMSWLRTNWLALGPS